MTQSKCFVAVSSIAQVVGSKCQVPSCQQTVPSEVWSKQEVIDWRWQNCHLPAHFDGAEIALKMTLTFFKNLGFMCIEGLGGGTEGIGQPGSCLFTATSKSYNILAGKYGDQVCRNL